MNEVKESLINIASLLYEKGWAYATSGNFSVRVSDERFLITASGKDKSALTEDDFVFVHTSGKPVDDSQKPSAETLLHAQLYQHSPGTGAVLHTHSVYSVLLSDYFRLDGKIILRDFEMLKALDGIGTHEAESVLPIFPNTQNMEELFIDVNTYMKENPPIHAYLIAGHGLYTWGSTLDSARRHVEGLEFLLEAEYRRLALPN